MGNIIRRFQYQVRPHTAMKSQVIADFLAEFSISTEEVMKEMDTLSKLELFVNGSSNAKVERGWHFIEKSTW